MEGATLIANVLPTLTLFAMMLAMGMTLSVADFRRIALEPRAAAFGLFGQLVALPAAAFAIAALLDLSEALRVGLVLIAACPGGVTSNALAFYARGDAALSISLTALSSLVAFLTVPFVVGLGLSLFAGGGAEIRLPLAATASTILVTTALPVGLGMAVRQRWPQSAERLHRPVLGVATGVLLLLVAGLGASLWSSEQDVAGLFGRGAPAIVLLVGALTALGLTGARALGLDAAQARTVAIEVGVQNFNLALVVGLTILGEPLYVGAALVYLPVMFAFAFGVIALARRDPYGVRA